ncbi:MAG: hypothetical protein ACLQU1_32455 [Bryobacteraceae bacterium]
MIFDRTRVKRFVPGYRAIVAFKQGIRQTMAWFDKGPAPQPIDDEARARWNNLIEACESGVQEALRQGTVRK